MRLLLLCLLFLLSTFVYGQNIQKPNVILIITDDQGYGDLGITGNPHVRTPNLDQLAKESVQFKNFYVSPVCAPTRASLMTGRYSLRTGVRDTYNGGAIMATEEVTIAEILKTSNYKTGIFGKWHLGDNYPSRPIDQGFEESLIHLSGGMGQVGDYTTYYQGDSSYFDPVLWHNGQEEKYDGYCSDIFAEGAIDFVKANKNEPFFCYLSFNAPHTPLQLPQEYYDMYQDVDPSVGFQNPEMVPEMNDNLKEVARKIYGMVTNIDDNVGRLLETLEELDLEDNTIIIFMTDNGPQQLRYTGGMRGKKGSVFRGGVRVPLYIKYPSKYAHKEVEINSAHIDLLPTIAELCAVEIPHTNSLDGRSLVPLMNDETEDWADRSLFFYWTRKFPELYNNIAIQRGKHKLVGHVSYDAKIEEFELFDIDQDPFEANNLVQNERALALDLKEELDSIYNELTTSENLLNPPLIEIGNQAENPLVLNRNDADGERGIWSQEQIFGKWNTRINNGLYDITFKFIKPLTGKGFILLETNSVVHRKYVQLENSDLITLKNVHLKDMEGEVVPMLHMQGKKVFPFWVKFEKIN